MNAALQIKASFDQPALLESLVEKLANRRYDIGYIDAQIPRALSAIETASTGTFVSGCMDISLEGNEQDTIHMPFITQFYFTCAKDKNEDYRMRWSASLS